MVFAIVSLAMADFQAEQASFRKRYEASLLGKEGWLSVASLMWLHEGPQALGAGDHCDLKLPASAPKLVGTVMMSGGKVTFQAADNVMVKLDGDNRTTGLFQRLEVGDLAMAVLQRGTRTGLRLWDPNAKTRREFKGCHWFPASEKWVVQAKWTPHPIGTTLPITNVLGDTTPTPNPGSVEFTIGGKDCHLEALEGGDGLFFIFKDGTSGKESYDAGRFLDTPGPKNGVVTMDFNKATNPPCAFTAFATCPLPPKGNKIPVRIEAGEQSHHRGDVK